MTQTSLAALGWRRSVTTRRSRLAQPPGRSGRSPPGSWDPSGAFLFAAPRPQLQKFCAPNAPVEPLTHLTETRSRPRRPHETASRAPPRKILSAKITLIVCPVQRTLKASPRNQRLRSMKNHERYAREMRLEKERDELKRHRVKLIEWVVDLQRERNELRRLCNAYRDGVSRLADEYGAIPCYLDDICPDSVLSASDERGDS